VLLSSRLLCSMRSNCYPLVYQLRNRIFSYEFGACYRSHLSQRCDVSHRNYGTIIFAEKSKNLSDTSSYMDMCSKNVWSLYLILTILLFSFNMFNKASCSVMINNAASLSICEWLKHMWANYTCIILAEEKKKNGQNKEDINLISEYWLFTK